MGQSSPAYQRILLKLSGEALLGSQEYGIDPTVIQRVAAEIAEVSALGVQVGLVIGGGNIFRGAGLAESSTARRLSAIRMWLRHLYTEGRRRTDPLARLTAPVLRRALPSTLSVEEVERLLTKKIVRSAEASVSVGCPSIAEALVSIPAAFAAR